MFDDLNRTIEALLKARSSSREHRPATRHTEAVDRATTSNLRQFGGGQIAERLPGEHEFLHCSFHIDLLSGVTISICRYVVQNMSVLWRSGTMLPFIGTLEHR